MAAPTDPRRRPKQLAALGAILFLVALTVGGVTMYVFEPTDYRGVPEYRQVAGDYIVVQDVFWHGSHMTGTWSVDGPGPDQIRLVDGRDADRILAGNEPKTVHATFEPWGPGRSIGTVDFDVPDFACSGPQGGCEDGDLPALVIQKGSMWEGTQRSQLQQDRMFVSVSLTYVDVAAPRMIMATSIVASLGVVTSLVGLTLWARTKRPKATQEKTGFEDAGTEAMLRLTRLSELYTTSILRSFWMSAVGAVVLGLFVHLFIVPFLADERLEDMIGVDALLIWYELLYWWAVPWLAIVGGTFWFSHWRVVRAELKRWRTFSARLDALHAELSD